MKQFVAFLLAVGCMAGCSPSFTTPPRTVSVTGKVYDSRGQLVQQGRLSLFAKGQGADAFATINRDGTFALSTFAHKDGVVPGTYVVVVNARSYGSRATTVVPSKYGDRDTSPLVITIAEDKPILTIQLR